MLKHCKIDKRGLPVPYVVLVDSQGNSHFKVNDSLKSLDCINKDLCSICGTKLDNDKWAVGGPASAFHIHGSYIDSPVHYECGKYALQVCPYLAYSGYHANIDIEKIQKLIADKVLLHNPTVDNDRLPLFVFAHITGYKVSPEGYIKVNKPYLQVEFWNNGELLSCEDGQAIVVDHFAKKGYPQEQFNWNI